MLQRLHRLVDGMSRSAALQFLASRLHGGMKFVLTAVNDTMAAAQTSELQSATGPIVRLRTASWARLIAMCPSMWIHPWPSSNLSTFSVEALRNRVQQEADPAMYVPIMLFAFHVNTHPQTDVRRGFAVAEHASFSFVAVTLSALARSL